MKCLFTLISFCLFAAVRTTVPPDYAVYISNGSYILTMYITDKGSNGLFFQITGSGFANGNYNYHIHEKPVVNGSCAATGGHFTQPNATYPCNKTMISSCEWGDLSGRFTPLTASNNLLSATEFTDTVLTLDNGPTSILGRSLVVHEGSPRIACGNILPYSELINVIAPGGSGTSSVSGGTVTPHTTSTKSASSTARTATPSNAASGTFEKFFSTGFLAWLLSLI